MQLNNIQHEDNLETETPPSRFIEVFPALKGLRYISMRPATIYIPSIAILSSDVNPLVFLKSKQFA